jgi:hypothetical protein
VQCLCRLVSISRRINRLFGWWWPVIPSSLRPA